MNEKKIIKKTCGFAKSVLRKTQEIFEISQLKFKMIQIKNRIERKYVKIGYFAYVRQKKEGLSGLKEEIEQKKFINVFKELDKLYFELNKLEDEYAEIKSYVKNQEGKTLKECVCKGERYKKEKDIDDENNSKKNEKDNIIIKDEDF